MTHPIDVSLSLFRLQFNGGVIVSVDSRATQGPYIGETRALAKKFNFIFIVMVTFVFLFAISLSVRQESH